MPFIEVEKNVFNQLQSLADKNNVMINDIIKSKFQQKKTITRKYKKSEKPVNIQDRLIPNIVLKLYENGGQAKKGSVETELYTQNKELFDKKYYQNTVSHGVPRWKHTIAWSKERAKQNHDYVKSAKDSGRSNWELTPTGIQFAETLINQENKLDFYE